MPCEIIGNAIVCSPRQYLIEHNGRTWCIEILRGCGAALWKVRQDREGDLRRVPLAVWDKLDEIMEGEG